jgi:hypothetical protein
MAAMIGERFDKQQARREQLVSPHEGFDVSAERRFQVSNVWPGENQSASYGPLGANNGRLQSKLTMRIFPRCVRSPTK